MRNFLAAAPVHLGTKGILIAATGLSTLLLTSVANAGVYLSYSATVNPLQAPYTGDNAPTLVYGTDTGNTVSLTNGLAKGSSSAPDAPAVTTTWSSPQLLFQVDPNPCLKNDRYGGCNTRYGATTTGNLAATVSVTFDFYGSSSGGTPLGTLTETAQADFAYTGYGSGTDNICWNSGPTATGGILVSATQTGTCSTTKSLNSGTGNELMEINLGGADYMIQLNDWTDWNEQPSIQFKAAPASVPEPASMTLLAAGLTSLGFLAHRRRKRRLLAAA